jgi:hypothetical protein
MGTTDLRHGCQYFPKGTDLSLYPDPPLATSRRSYLRSVRTKERHAPGKVREAIVASLRHHSDDASVGETHQAVEAGLGDVPASSVRSYLSLNTGPGKLFERTTRGKYRIH